MPQLPPQSQGHHGWQGLPPRLANDVLLVSKILLGYEKALWPKKLEISHASQILTNDRQILVLS